MTVAGGLHVHVHFAGVYTAAFCGRALPLMDNWTRRFDHGEGGRGDSTNLISSRG
jgi:hypothetical protein